MLVPVIYGYGFKYFQILNYNNNEMYYLWK